FIGGKLENLGYWELLGIFGSFASILSLFISGNGPKQKIIHIGYAVFIVASVLAFTDYQAGVQSKLSELEQIKSIEAQADALLVERDLSTAGLKAGYSLSVLTFFEKHRSLYPDSYKRAVSLCESAGCTDVSGTLDNDSINNFSKLQHVSRAMRELVRGVSSLDRQKT
ncbi:hypothetical protein ACWOKN_004405, partial [Vibrio vulnificus]